MKRLYFKTVAIILSICLTITCLPVTTWATSDYSADDSESSSIQTVAEPYIIYEIESKREQNVKHYRMSDGNYMVATYDLPVHFKDSENVWQEYDNSLQESNSSKEELSNTKSDLHISLSKKAKQNKLATITIDAYEISWGYSKVNNSPIVYENKAQESCSAELVNVTQEAWYYDVYDDVDLQYLILPYGLKENIVLNSKNTPKEFLVNYKIGALSAVQTDSQTIELREVDGNVVYTIKAPMMIDSAENMSDAVTLQIVKTTGNGICVKISASQEWLKSTDRKYPVYIDPWVETTQTTTEIESASLLSNSVPSSNYPYGSLYVGRESSEYGRTVSVIKTTLPTLNAGDMVVGGQLALRQSGYYGNSDVQVNVSKITSSWSQSNYINSGTIAAGYPIRPSINSKIEDFNIANATTLADGRNGNLTYWDITSVVKGWYNGEANNGVMIWANDPDANNYVRYVRADDYGSYSNSSFPVILISYVNNNGLESIWSYHDMSVTGRGNAYVNDYTGNLVVAENIFNTTGNRMPMSISLVYNLRNYNKNFRYGASAGYGFMFNFQQRIDAVTDSDLLSKGYKYIYTDADGTEHYFRQKEGSTTEWIDEEGLELVLKETGDSGIGMYLHYKDGTVSHFYTTDSSGLLFFTKDTYGNRVRYYSTTPFGSDYGRLITSIEDGAGRTVTVTYELYNNVPRVKSMTDNEGRIYTFAYDTSDPTLLKSITYPDATVTTFSYNSKRLSAVTDSLGYKTEFTFVGTGNITKTQIKTVTSYSVENGTNYLVGRLTFTYNKDNTTTVTDYDGRSQIYQFDNLGRTTSVRYPDGTITNAAYHSTAGSNKSGTAAPAAAINNNKLISESTSEKYVNNYVVNSSAELNSSFYNSPWAGSGEGAFSYDSSVAYLGLRSLKINNDTESKYFNFHGQQMFTTDFDDADFTFSAYVKTENVVTQYSHGAGLILQFYDTNGTSLNITYSKYFLTGTNDWTRISVSGHAPAGTVQVRVYCGLMYAQGTAWFDCLQLEKSSVVNDYNLVENSNFTKTTKWTTANYTSGDSLSGNGMVTVTGGATANKYVYQYMPVNKADVCFNVFGTVSGNLAAQRNGRLTGLEICLIYSDGKAEYPNKQFNPATSAEQSISFTVKPKRKGVVVREIGVYYIVRNTANTTNLKNVMVTFDESGTSYSYDADGNLISSADNAERNQAYEYNNAKELTKYTNDKNESYSYIYDSANAHKLTAVRSNQLGNGYTYSYDSYGNVTGTKMGTVNASGVLDTSLEYLSSSIGYDSTGNYVISETDTRNNTVTYDINTANGLTNSVTSPATVDDADTTVTTDYTYYDITRLLQTVSSGDAEVEYVYDAKRRLSAITANGNTYTFTYDVYGNRTSVKVGDNTLITYNYATPRNGLVTSSVYANGHTVGYLYDSFDRLVAKTQNGSETVRVYYNNKGQTARVNDISAGNTEEYIFDLAGRLVQSHTYGNRRELVKYKYDTMNRLTEETPYAGIDLIQSVYNYGSDSLLSSMYQGILYFTYTYDHLNRITVENIELYDGNTVKNEYTYENGTTLVATRKFYINNVLTETLAYTYDKWGNIKTQSKDGVLQESYTYDELNQLKTVTKGSDVYEYTYDNGGNILNVKLNGVVTDTYTYGDENWKDKLTAYNGQTITYDSIGNPLTYRDGMTFSWQNGRRLSSLQQGENVVQYTYDDSGLRIAKNLNGTSTNFYYDDSGKLFRIGDGSGMFWLFYGTDGSAMSFKHRDIRYYYVKNQQGDITAIVDMFGNTVAKYSYDVWGKPLSITDGNGNDVSTNATHIANINPLRYRGYYYDSESGLYYLQSRYYDPEVGRFISADGYVSTGQGVLSNNMFAYCGNNPVNRVDHTGQFWSEIWEFAKDVATEIRKAMGTMSPAYAGLGGVAIADGPLPFGDAVAGVGFAVVTLFSIAWGINRATHTPSISVPKVEEKDVTAPPPSNGVTYYHVTTPDNAIAIMTSGVMTGSKWESGYVYAWKKKPNKYAIENSGAHMGVTISFKTSASFVMDTGITDPKVQKYGPVVSAAPGPIVVWDVQIVW